MSSPSMITLYNIKILLIFWLRRNDIGNVKIQLIRIFHCAASLRRYYPVQVVRVRSSAAAEASISAMCSPSGDLWQQQKPVKGSALHLRLTIRDFQASVKPFLKKSDSSKEAAAICKSCLYLADSCGILVLFSGKIKRAKEIVYMATETNTKKRTLRQAPDHSRGKVQTDEGQ